MFHPSDIDIPNKLVYANEVAVNAPDARRVDYGMQINTTLPNTDWNYYIKEACKTNNESLSLFSEIYGLLGELCANIGVEIKDQSTLNGIAEYLTKDLQFNVVTPIGVIFAFGGTTAPDNYLICDGREFSNDTYPELYAILGINRTPDWRELVPVMAGTSLRNNIFEHDEFSVGEFKDDCIASHTHNLSNVGFTYNAVIGIHSIPGGSDGAFNTQEDRTTSIANGRSANVTRDKSYGVNYIIKAK